VFTRGPLGEAAEPFPGRDPLADLDWNAAQAIGTIVAAGIAVFAFFAARRAADAERRRNEQQARLDGEQQAHIGVLADAVRRIAEQQDGQQRALADRVAELESKRDPAGAERRKADRARQDAEANRELADIGKRLEKITVLRRDGMAGGGWSPATMDRKRIIRYTSKPRPREAKCGECGATLKESQEDCPDCGAPVAA
jgi:hypothetical protein